MGILNYSSIAVAATLSQAVEATDTTFQFSSTTGWPAVPFKLIVDKDRPAEEVVICVSLSSVTGTVLRGQDGTPASHHDVAAPVVHGFSASEFQDPNDHINASSNVHGVAGALVGSASAQILDKKTFQSATGSAPPIVVQAQTGQSGNILDLRADTGSVIGGVTAAGRIATPGIDGSTASVFTAGSGAQVPVTIRMAPGQTARPLKILDSGNAEIMAVAPSGQVICQSVQVTGGTALGTTTGSSLTLSGDLSAVNGNFSGSTTISGNASVGGTLSASNFSASGTLNVTGLTTSNQITQRANVPVPIVAAGTVNVSVSAGSFGSNTVTWPSGRFTQPPIVTCSLQNAPTNSGKYSARATNIDSNGCSIQLYSGDGSANTFTGSVGWVAVQMTGASSSG